MGRGQEVRVDYALDPRMERPRVVRVDMVNLVGKANPVDLTYTSNIEDPVESADYGDIVDHSNLLNLLNLVYLLVLLNNESLANPAILASPAYGAAPVYLINLVNPVYHVNSLYISDTSDTVNNVNRYW